MEGLFNEEDIKRILAENDPINTLSKPELELLEKILEEKKKALGSMPATLARREEYNKISKQLRLVQNKLDK